MSVDVNLHADKYVANVREFIWNDKDASKMLYDPFITFEVTSVDEQKIYSTDPAREIQTHTGSVTLYVRSAEDATRILQAAKELLASVHRMELEKKIQASLDEEESSWIS